MATKLMKLMKLTNMMLAHPARKLLTKAVSIYKVWEIRLDT
jgi:hypothetical protein